MTITEIAGVVSIGMLGLQTALTVTAPLTLTGTPAKTLGLDTSGFITAMPVPPLWNMFQIVQKGVVGLLQAGPYVSITQTAPAATPALNYITTGVSGLQEQLSVVAPLSLIRSRIR